MSSVAPDNTVCPPWARSRSRAVRSIVEPACSRSSRSCTSPICTPMRSRIGASGAVLRSQRTSHRVGRAGECDHEAVTLTLLHRPHPTIGGDDFGDGSIEPCEGYRHLVGLGLPKPCGTLDVCQKQRRHSCRQEPAQAQLTPVHQRVPSCSPAPPASHPRRASHRRVEPTTSVNRNVTTPEGAASDQRTHPQNLTTHTLLPRTSADPAR